MNQTVYVGMSGGVDSSVTAALLKEQGYKVVGVYMKNWSQDLPGMVCPWQEDYQDAKRVAVQLGIDFKMYDFQTEYRQKVVNYMVGEYQFGRTPNPDIMCNQEVKFKLFLETALEDGADMIATGHYARIQRLEINGEANTKGRNDLIDSPGKIATGHYADIEKSEKIGHNNIVGHIDPINSRSQLMVAANKEKDQTYFLYRVTSEALVKSLMPIGDFESKEEVRAMAKKLGLATAAKKDSQGICFVGKVGIKDFLLYELGPQVPGAIVEQNGVTIGQHDGAIFYTIGQRHGLDVGGGLPYYVVGKDMAKNEVYVTTQLDDERLWHDKLQLTDLHWINEAPEVGKTYKVRVRYRAPLVNCKIDSAKLTLDNPVRAITPGQSAVIYDGDRVVGGGIVI